MEVILRVEEREYIEPEKVSEEVINAINIVKEYCKVMKNLRIVDIVCLVTVFIIAVVVVLGYGI